MNFSYFLRANHGKLHMACHSHHYWPDVTLQAHSQYWHDTALLVDDKWSKIFGEIVPETQALLADILHTSHPQNIVFAPNTQELFARILSCLPSGKPIRILSTDSEFHSFERLTRRMEEDGLVEVTRVPADSLTDFESRFCTEAKKGNYDLIFFSQVFYNSGISSGNLNKIVQQIADAAPWVVVDGYHAFGAIPVNLKNVEDKIFYIAGGYKYAMAGEGACFMHVPKKALALRPVNTGWFAEFGSLDNRDPQKVVYAPDGLRFAGATMDYSAVYRLRAVLQWWPTIGLGVENKHTYIQQRQHDFLAVLSSLSHPLLNDNYRLFEGWERQGHFITYALTPEQAKELHLALKAKNIETDYRNGRLRFGFAIYHDTDDYNLLASIAV